MNPNQEPEVKAQNLSIKCDLPPNPDAEQSLSQAYEAVADFMDGLEQQGSMNE